MTRYIVRVYRRDQVSAEINGIAEIPEQEVRTAFHNFAELKTILIRKCTKEPLAGDFELKEKRR